MTVLVRIVTFSVIREYSVSPANLMPEQAAGHYISFSNGEVNDVEPISGRAGSSVIRDDGTRYGSRVDSWPEGAKSVVWNPRVVSTHKMRR